MTTTFAAFFAVVVVVSIIAVNLLDNLDHPNRQYTAAIVASQAELTTQVLRNQADGLCPSYSRTEPLHTEIRAALRCDHFGH